MTGRPPLRARARAIALLCSIVLTLGLIEAGARLLLPRMRPRPPFGRSAIQRAWLERTERELAAGVSTPSASRFDADLGWTARPGYASADGRVHVNARGVRSAREYRDPPPAGVRRVVACGESFTFGDEVSDAEAWPARLEARVPGLEAWNYGVGGYGSDQALLRLAREARAPVEAVVVGLMLENIGRNVNRYRPLWYPGSQPAAKPRFRLDGARLALVPQPYATLASFTAAVRSGEVFAGLAEHEHWNASYLPRALEWSAAARIVAGRRAYAEREPRRLWSDPRGEPFRTTLAILDSFPPLARSLGARRVLVLIFPGREDLRGLVERGDRYWARLPAALAARGIEHLDLATPLAAEARDRQGVDALFLESHLTPRGNDLVAREVAAWLNAANARGERRPRGHRARRVASAASAGPVRPFTDTGRAFAETPAQRPPDDRRFPWVTQAATGGER